MCLGVCSARKGTLAGALMDSVGAANRGGAYLFIRTFRYPASPQTYLVDSPRVGSVRGPPLVVQFKGDASAFHDRPPCEEAEPGIASAMGCTESSFVGTRRPSFR